MHFAGPAADRIYVEFCYETRDPPLLADEAEAGADGATLPGTAQATVWCAGYVVFAVEGATTATLPVSRGSLLQSKNPTPATPAATASATPSAAAAPHTDATGRKAAKRWKGLCAFTARFSKHKHKMAAEAASNVKIEVVKAKKSIPGMEKMPERFIAFQRHIPMIAQLRSAVELVGKETDHALQALRQQAVRYIFSVAADAALLDQLCKLWTHRTRHWSKAERGDTKEQHVQLLSCVAALYALSNCCASSKQQLAQALIKGKPSLTAVDEGAPLLPVRV
ncbi:hypothetical protein NQL31_007256 [Lotmaria passim]